jgi:DNA primase
MLHDEIGDATPELRAKLNTRLIEASGRITDKSLSWEYRRALLDKFKASRTRPQRGGTQGRQGKDAKWDRRRVVLGIPDGMRAPRPVPGHDYATSERARILTAILLRHPFLLHDVAQAYNTLPMDAALTRLRETIELWAEDAETLDSAGLMDHLTKSGFELEVQHVLAAVPMPLPACASDKAMPAEAESGWWHIFGFLNQELLREEVEAAQAEASRNLTPETWRRQKALVEALAKIRSGEPDGIGLTDV